MFFIAMFDNKDFNIKHHAKSIMMEFICVSYDCSDLDIEDDIKHETFDDLDDIVCEYDYNRFRRLMQKYNVTVNHLISKELLDKYHGAGGRIMSYTSITQLKHIYIKNIKNNLKKFDKNSKEYKETMKLYGKVKMLNDPAQLLEASMHAGRAVGQEIDYENKVFYDYEDYIQYVFDNQ